MLELWELSEPTRDGKDVGSRLGTIRRGRRLRIRPPRSVAVANFLIATVLVGAGLAGLWLLGARDPSSASALGIAAFVYLALAYVLHPKPNMDNLGWRDGLFDDPLRFTDDINRRLAQDELLLRPGRYITESFVVFFTWRSLPTLSEFLAAKSQDESFDDVLR